MEETVKATAVQVHVLYENGVRKKFNLLHPTVSGDLDEQTLSITGFELVEAIYYVKDQN